MTDFGLLTHHVRATRDVGPLSDLLGRQVRLHLPGGEVTLAVRMPDNQTLIIESRGEGISTLDFAFQHEDKEIIPSGENFSYSEDDGENVESRFEDAVPEEAVVVVTYLDRIEPL